MWELHEIGKITRKRWMHCLKNVLFKNVIGVYHAIKYAFTNYDTASICHSWNSGRYFYKTHLATLALGDAVGVRCWWVPLAGRQVTVFLLRRLCPCRRSYITTVQRWCWTPTMVCAVTPPLQSLNIRVLYILQSLYINGPTLTCKVISPGRKKNILPIMKK